MNDDNWRHALILVVAIGLTFEMGCSNDSTARISGRDLQAGDHAPARSFVGEESKVEKSGSVRRVVTLLVFPAMPHWPKCQHGEQIARVAGQYAEPNTPIALVSIGIPDEGEKKSTRLYRCQFQGPAQLIAPHVRHGRMRGFYNSKAAGAFSVIDSNGRIVAIGSLNDLDGMSAALQSAVAEHERCWQEPNEDSEG